MMKQHRKLAGYRNDGLTLGLLAASASQVEAPLSQRRVSPMWSKDVIGALDQETSKIGVAGMRNAELRIVISGLTSPRSQAEVATHIATSSEPLLAA